MGKGKSILVIGLGGPKGCETSRLTDGGVVVSLTCRPRFTLIKIPGIHFC
jgi:hypothetical protein